jgi:hypothetical protein
VKKHTQEAACEYGAGCTSPIAATMKTLVGEQYTAHDSTAKRNTAGRKRSWASPYAAPIGLQTSRPLFCSMRSMRFQPNTLIENIE